jgi:hypothetical protein
MFKCYLTDAPIKTTTRTKIIKDSGLARKTSVIDNLARRTHVSTYFGSEYSSLREVDDLKIFDNSNDSQPPKLVCVYPGSAFICENESDVLKVFWMSADPVGTSTIGDRKTGMTSAKYQSQVVLKVRELAARGLR